MSPTVSERKPVVLLLECKSVNDTRKRKAIAMINTISTVQKSVCGNEAGGTKRIFREAFVSRQTADFFSILYMMPTTVPPINAGIIRLT